MPPVRAESLAEGVEPFITGFLQRGIRLVGGNAARGHHAPRLSLRRATAAEDHEVIGVGDYVGTIGLCPVLDTPKLQKAIDVQVGEQGCDG